MKKTSLSTRSQKPRGGAVPGVEQQIPREPRVLMVNRNQNTNDIIQQVRHDDVAADNNLAAMVERIMVRNGVNFGLRMPNYTSPLSEYILQAEVPPRTKIPKLTKFSGDTTESIIEHVTRYLIEAGDMSNNESLKIKKKSKFSHEECFHMVHHLAPKFDPHLEPTRENVP